jgi:D-glycero-D-manno-heptose 1,7-bisphosphate phosphatase
MGHECPRDIVVDRDGVLNVEAEGLVVASVDTWQWIDQSRDALMRLRTLGFSPGLVSNQSIIGRGIASRAAIQALHQVVFAGLVEPAAMFVCPHAPDAGCECRKPAPGSLLAAARHFACEPGKLLFVGDAVTDWQASRAAGVMFALVRTGKGLATEAHLTESGRLDSLWGGRAFDGLRDVVACIEETCGGRN